MLSCSRGVFSPLRSEIFTAQAERTPPLNIIASLHLRPTPCCRHYAQRLPAAPNQTFTHQAFAFGPWCVWINRSPIRPHHSVPENSAVEVSLLYYEWDITVGTGENMETITALRPLRLRQRQRLLHLNSPAVRVITGRHLLSIRKMSPSRLSPPRDHRQHKLEPTLPEHESPHGC